MHSTNVKKYDVYHQNKIDMLVLNAFQNYNNNSKTTVIIVLISYLY